MTAVRQAYPRYFYERLTNSRSTATRIVAAILEDVVPASVVDVGCGVGAYLAAFTEAGVADVYGLDLPPRDLGLLQIPEERFRAQDLTQPLDAWRKFDLAMSLEVAEHLSESAADTFVTSLTSLSDIVVFSAAIPRQGGWEHINEQWQDWWVRKFAERGLVAIDSLRDRIWNDSTIPFYYRQNILMFVRKEVLDTNAKLAALHHRTQHNSLSRVHPDAYLEKAEPSRITLRFALEAAAYLPRASLRALGRRIGPIASR